MRLGVMRIRVMGIRVMGIVRIRGMMRIDRIVWIRGVVRVRGVMRIVRIVGRMIRMAWMFFLPDSRSHTGCLEPVELGLVLAHVRRIRAPVEALLDWTGIRVLPALHRHCRSRQSDCRHRTSS